MQNSARLLIGFVFAALVIGGFFTISGGEIPAVEQVTNPDASTLSGTGDKLAQLALVVVVAGGAVMSIAIALAVSAWFLNKQIVRAALEEPKPVNIPQLSSPQVALQQSGSAISVVQKNIFPIVVTIGVLAVMTFLILVFSGNL
ncbi:MAG: hypothetical protein HY862_06000 [Chloroflexi bacterium]|nr:hypothetical protein [Chloroflexota bacterium]